MGISLETESLNQVSTDGSEWIEIRFGAVGTRANVEAFIRALEFAPYVSRVQSVRLIEDSANRWGADIIMQVQLLTYDE